MHLFATSEETAFLIIEQFFQDINVTDDVHVTAEEDVERAPIAKRQRCAAEPIILNTDILQLIKDALDSAHMVATAGRNREDEILIELEDITGELDQTRRDFDNRMQDYDRQLNEYHQFALYSLSPLDDHNRSHRV